MFLKKCITYKPDLSYRHHKASLCSPAGESDLAGVVVLRVEKVAELRQQLRPCLQLPFRGDGRDQDTLEERQ